MTPRQVRMFLVVFIIGVLLGLAVNKAAAQMAALILAAVLLTAMFLRTKHKKIIMLFCLALLLSFWRSSHYSQSTDLPPQMAATVYQDTSATAYGSMTLVKTDSGRLLRVVWERYPEYKSGDRINITLKPTQPDHGGFVRGSAELIARNEGNWFIRQSAAIRRTFIQGVAKVLPEPQATFASGTVVGGSAGMPTDLKDDITVSGLSHVLAASGYNFSLLLIFIGFLLHPLSLKKQTFILLIVIPVFVLVAGASPPVIRAGVMAGLALMAVLFGRISAAKTAVLWAAAIMLVINPAYIKLDLGWQLSFLATLGLIWLLPIAERLTGLELLSTETENFKGKLKNMLIGIFFATLAAQLATIPLLAFTFGTASLVSLPVNILVLPLVPLIMIGTVFAAVFAFIWLPLGLILATPAWLATTFIFKVAQFAAGLPRAQIFLDYSLAKAAVSYIILLLGAWFLHRKYFKHRHQLAESQNNLNTEKQLI